jgi:predicted DNA-binding transcriptional regulator AlpA
MENPFEIARPFDRTESIATQPSGQELRLVQPPRKPPRRVADVEPLLTAEDVAKRLNVSTDWVWDHSSRKKPLLPVIRMGDGALRYRASGIEAFIDERERLGALRRRG